MYHELLWLVGNVPYTIHDPKIKSNSFLSITDDNYNLVEIYTEVHDGMVILNSSQEGWFRVRVIY